MLKPKVWRGVCSSVRLDTNILIGTSVFNYQTLKTLFSPNSSNQMVFAKKLCGIHFFSSTCGQNYELIWSDITAQTVTLGANLLFKANTIPQKNPKVAFTNNIYILNIAKVFEIWLFCNIEISENT